MGDVNVSLDHLPTLGDLQRIRRAVPKHRLATKLDRAVQKVRQRGGDKTTLHKWARAVKERDHWLDRYDGRPVVETNASVPRRAEAHHIVPRSDKAVRHDVRNGVTLSWENHEKVERNQLRIIGTRWFQVNGRTYIDGTHPVRFQELT